MSHSVNHFLLECTEKWNFEMRITTWEIITDKYHQYLMVIKEQHWCAFFRWSQLAITLIISLITVLISDTNSNLNSIHPTSEPLTSNLLVKLLIYQSSCLIKFLVLLVYTVCMVCLRKNVLVSQANEEMHKLLRHSHYYIVA